jgi:hypothetical protein
MGFLGETLDVPKGCLTVSMCPKVASDYLLEILQAVDQVSGQVIESGPGRVSQVNGEELDDEKMVICPARPAREAVVLQPNAGICFVVIFDNAIRCPKAYREACVAHVAP